MRIFEELEILDLVLIVGIIIVVILSIVFGDPSNTSETDAVSPKALNLPIRKYDIDQRVTIYEFADKKYNHCVVAKGDNAISIDCIER